MRTVSVVVLIKDEENILPHTMPSIASLSPLIKEVIYIDDGSTDNSYDVAHKIASQFSHFPLIWIEHKMEKWNEQRNVGLDRATGDFIVSIDADMSFTGNMRWEIEKGKFDRHDVWDFKIWVCRPDVYHYDLEIARGFTQTTRVIKNSGVRYIGDAHEQPEVYAAVSKTDLQARKIGDRPSKGTSGDVWFFELSLLLPDSVLMERGRRLERFRKEMTDRGIPPPLHDRYMKRKHSDSEVREVPPEIRDMVVTMEDALKHWGK